MHRSCNIPWELVWILSVFEQACVLVILQAVNELEDLTRCGEAVRLGQGSDVQAASLLLRTCGLFQGIATLQRKKAKSVGFMNNYANNYAFGGQHRVKTNEILTIWSP